VQIFPPVTLQTLISQPEAAVEFGYFPPTSSQSSDFVIPSQADRTQELCAQASATNDPKELERVILELQIAIHVHSEKLKIMVAKHRSDLLPANGEKAA